VLGYIKISSSSNISSSSSAAIILEVIHVIHSLSPSFAIVVVIVCFTNKTSNSTRLIVLGYIKITSNSNISSSSSEAKSRSIHSTAAVPFVIIER
jgi:hypothetical protein